MKILVSAYACEPNKGSEPSVGWNWVTNLAKYHEVFVITRENNKKNIENEATNNINFYYYDLPKLFLMLKKTTGFTLIYYYLWQFGAYFKYKNITKDFEFDLAHHVTFANFKIFTFLAFLDVPLIFGPVGGGERTPYRLYKQFSLKNRLKEFIRDLDIYLCRLNPLTIYTWYKSKKILVTTEETKNKIPKLFRHKTEIMQAIGIEDRYLCNVNDEIKISKNDNLNIGYIGNLLELKGTNILVDSFYKYNKIYNMNSTLTIIGDGPAKKTIKNKVEKYKINRNVNMLGKLSREEVIECISNIDILVFPSFHDSGGLVVLECMANNIPVIVLNLGGPGNNVNNNVGISINPTNFSDIVNNISKSINSLLVYESDTKDMIIRANIYIRETFTWKNKICKINCIYDEIIGEKYEK